LNGWASGNACRIWRARASCRVCCEAYHMLPGKQAGATGVTVVLY
jgi:hypothetical protein